MYACFLHDIYKMDEHNRIHSINYGERVSSNYAEIYHDDDYCEFKPTTGNEDKNAVSKTLKTDMLAARDEWISPSDLLIGKVDLVPPFTSRITRGITHDGILKIGEAVLQRERAKFLKILAGMLVDNDAAWTHIQEEEKKIIEKKVRAIYERIFAKKSSMMQKEFSWFYEDTLRELEHHLRSEVRTILMSTHCNMISDLNKEIKEKLENEQKTLARELRKKYDSEVRKMNKYYKLLLHNEKHRSNKLVNQAISKRNEAFTVFCKQVEAEATTSTMYVMCTERKKCRMRKFLLENFHSNEIEEKLKIIKEKQNILDEFQKNKKQILDINRDWEEKVKKILQLFLKFISFSLKLLPEQTTFLLDLEKLVVLQLNEIQKHPEKARCILINEDDFKNLFEFQDPTTPEFACDKAPFVIEGDLTPSVSTEYGSRETIPSHKELPYFRLNRQFIYAKCQQIDQVKKLLQYCKCHDQQITVPEDSSSSEQICVCDVCTPIPEPTPQSSNELFLVNDIPRLQQCPSRGCQDYINKLSFPNLDEYMDYTQKKFSRVQAILGTPAKLQPAPELLKPKDIVFRELPFAATKDPKFNKETQYSSHEELPLIEDLTCDCMVQQPEKSYDNLPEEKLEAILIKRKESLKRIMHENPKLMKLFSEESYDFIF